jgi:hypothetical protein
LVTPAEDHVSSPTFFFSTPERIRVNLLEKCWILGHASSPAVFGAMLLKDRTLVLACPGRVAESLAVLNEYLSEASVKRVVTTRPCLVAGYGVANLTSSLDRTFKALGSAASRDRIEKCIAQHPDVLLYSDIEQRLARAADAFGITYDQV